MPTIDAFIIDKLGRRPRQRPNASAELPVELPATGPDRPRPTAERQGYDDEEKDRPRGVIVLDT